MVEIIVDDEKLNASYCNEQRKWVHLVDIRKFKLINFSLEIYRTLLSYCVLYLIHVSILICICFSLHLKLHFIYYFDIIQLLVHV